MQFSEKLQELRRQRNLTQEQLASILYVSRTAVSKWESGRGYPNIDSLKAIAECFSVSVDDLLSGNELLSLAEDHAKQKECNVRATVFTLLDLGAIIFFFLPLFRQIVDGAVRTANLVGLNQVSTGIRIAYFLATGLIILCGVLAIVLRHRIRSAKYYQCVSFFLNACGAVLFILGMQPYAATVLFLFIAIKAILLFRHR